MFSEQPRQYIVNVKEISYGHIEVNANCDEEAIEKARKIYNDGNTVWCGIENEIYRAE